MRDWIKLFEADYIEPSRVSKGCQVYHVRSRRHLDALIERYHTVRGMMFGNVIDVWEAEHATHNAYEMTFGDMGGYRLMLAKGQIAINVYDYEDRDNPIAEFKKCEMVTKIFPDIDQWDIGVNEL